MHEVFFLSTYRQTRMNTAFSRQERLEKVRTALEQEGLAALMCANNLNVLLLSGYWPVVGASVAIATPEPGVALIVPEDEVELARTGWADEVLSFQPASLESLREAIGAIANPLEKILRKHDAAGGRVGYEAGSAHLPASYASLHSYGESLHRLVQSLAPQATLQSADALLGRLRACPTASECEAIRIACRIAEQAYRTGMQGLRPGMTETEGAALFHDALIAGGIKDAGMRRHGGFFYCMSGQNSAKAYAAYQRSRSKILERGESVLVHCNSYVDGYWTDLTRTYFLGAPDQQARQYYQIIFAARAAALGAIRPGVTGAEVDRAARAVVEKSGCGHAFKHATGHGVGFSPIDHNERPRIHPCSTDVLEAAMVFNVEPGIYFPSDMGLRHCDMVRVNASGTELLSPFHCTPEELQIPC